MRVHRAPSASASPSRRAAPRGLRDNRGFDPNAEPPMSTPPDNPLLAYFEANSGRMINKWLHYFDAYHRHFARFRGTACTLVEIGVFQGGSLQMWKHYLGPQARIIGVDVEPACKAIEEPQIEIVIGDQSDRAFLRDLRRRLGTIDVLIDDGGHHMRQLLTTFEELYGALSPHGVYVAEDLHTCYWREYGGGFRHPYSFIEFSKILIDQLNAYHSRDSHSFPVTPFTQTAASMHYYDSMLVIEKQPRARPIERQTGRAEVVPRNP